MFSELQKTEEQVPHLPTNPGLQRSLLLYRGGEAFKGRQAPIRASCQLCFDFSQDALGASLQAPLDSSSPRQASVTLSHCWLSRELEKTLMSECVCVCVCACVCVHASRQMQGAGLLSPWDIFGSIKFEVLHSIIHAFLKCVCIMSGYKQNHFICCQGAHSPKGTLQMNTSISCN